MAQSIQHRAKGQIFIIAEKRLTKTQYIDFLNRSDLGQQYPLEDFEQRISRLLKNSSISLIAKNEKGLVVGICFGLSDFAYWLLVTDLGVDRNHMKIGLGKAMMRFCHKLAGGNKKITLFAHANPSAVPFYEKLGMKKSKQMMELRNTH